MEPFERAFLFGDGELVGAFKHLGADDQDLLRIELIAEEAIKTSTIKGEVFDHAGVQSSLRRKFGLDADTRRAGRAEQGIAEMRVDLYRSFAAPLTHLQIFVILLAHPCAHGLRWDRLGDVADNIGVEQVAHQMARRRWSDLQVGVDTKNAKPFTAEQSLIAFGRRQQTCV